MCTHSCSSWILTSLYLENISDTECLNIRKSCSNITGKARQYLDLFHVTPKTPMCKHAVLTFEHRIIKAYLLSNPNILVYSCVLSPAYGVVHTGFEHFDVKNRAWWNTHPKNFKDIQSIPDHLCLMFQWNGRIGLNALPNHFAQMVKRFWTNYPSNKKHHIVTLRSKVSNTGKTLVAIEDPFTKQIKLQIHNRFVCLGHLSKQPVLEKLVGLRDPIIVQVNTYFQTQPFRMPFVQKNILSSELSDQE